MSQRLCGSAGYFSPTHFHGCRRRDLTRREGCHIPVRRGQSGSGILPLPLVHAGQAAGSRFHFQSAFMEAGSDILPLDVIQPEPRRLCHVAAE